MLVKNNKETIMKFKSVAAALLAAVTCVSMAACGSGGDTNADGKVEITMWHNSTTGDGKAYWESAAKAFEKENPNVTIKDRSHSERGYGRQAADRSAGPEFRPRYLYGAWWPEAT